MARASAAPSRPSSREWGTNTIGVFPGRTSEQAGGDKAGVQVRFTLDDVDRVANSVPGIIHISPAVYKDVPVQNDLHTYTWSVNGVRPVYQDILKLDTDQGRFFNGAEDQQRAHVCVIGSEAKTKLFSGGWALGEDHPPERRVCSPSSACSRPRCRRADDDINRQIYIPFNTMSDLKDTQYLDGIWFNYTGDNELAEKSLRETLAAAHHFRPSDHNAIYVANLMTQLHQFSILSHRPAGAALAGGRAHAGHRRHRPDEHHAGGRAAAHPRDRHRKSAGRAPAATS